MSQPRRVLVVESRPERGLDLCRLLITFGLYPVLLRQIDKVLRDTDGTVSLQAQSLEPARGNFTSWAPLPLNQFTLAFLGRTPGGLIAALDIAEDVYNAGVLTIACTSSLPVNNKMITKKWAIARKEQVITEDFLVEEVVGWLDLLDQSEQAQET